MLLTPRTRSVAVPASHPFSSFSLLPVQWQYGASGFRYSISPPRSNFPRVRAIMRSRLAFTSGARSRRMINRSASARIESSACMKFPFFRLLVSSGMIGEGGGFGVRPMPVGVAWRREAVASLDARRLAGATSRSKGRFSRAGRRADPSRRSGRARERKSGRRA